MEIELSSHQIFQIMRISEKNPGRNNHNASKLIEKYNNLAREALSSGDKIYQKTISNTLIISQEFK